MILWLTIPPLLSLPLSLLLVAFGNESNKVSAGAPLWVLLLLLYFAFSMFYVFSIRNSLFSQLPPLQMAAQGIIICIVSMEAGAHPILPWVGVLAAVSGFFILLHSYSQYGRGTHLPPPVAHAESPSSDTASEPWMRSPFPYVVLDNEGTIIDANDAFASFAENGSVQGENVTTFFVPGETEAVVGGKKHAIFQKAKDGQFHFLLVDNPPAQKNSKTAEAKSELELFDPKYGLYSRKYAQLRIPEELGRANRYRRWLCGILLKVNYTYLPGRGRQPALEETFLAAYVLYVKESIRESDMGFSMQDGEFLLLLPETPQQGAKDTALKLIVVPESLDEMKKDYPFSVDIEYGFLYYSGNYPLSYDQFIQKLYASLGGSAE